MEATKEAPGRETQGQNARRTETQRQEKFNVSGGKSQVKVAAVCCSDKGFSVLPVDPKSKRPLETWKHLQATPLTPRELSEKNFSGFALICGKVSGNLEILDFDFKAALFEPWKNIIEDEAPGLIKKLLIQRTQSGGLHLVYRCPGLEIPSNQELAFDRIRVEGPGEHQHKGKTLRAQKETDGYFIYPCQIETRGTGGYFLAAPTPGYQVTNGHSFLALPSITPEERQILFRAARALNKKVITREPRNYSSEPDGQRPGDIFNQKGDIKPLLEKHGWTQTRSNGDFEHWARPGKARGWSASLIDGKILYNFSTNAAPFEPEKAYSPFSVYGLLEHGGNFEQAARDLKAQGYYSQDNTSQTTSTPTPEKPSHAQKIRPITIYDFLKREFPPRQNILDPWLPGQGLVMVYAYRGVGKTYFALGVGYAAICGGQFLTWTAPQPSGVLYIDGEMPGPVMQERLSMIVANSELEPRAPFMLLTPDLQPEGMPRLDTTEGQATVESILTPEIKFIIVDNISTLTSARENEADGWTPIQAWALRQRAKGRAVMFIHHSGKTGTQRGTSRREDVLDTVLSLKRPIDYEPSMGAVFEIHFEKARGLYGDDVSPIEARLSTDDNNNMAWLTRPVEACNYDRVVELLKAGLTQKEVAQELNLNKSTVSRHAKRARQEGLITNLGGRNNG